jgi:GNAT superfamily N-acetyltransferase
VESRKPWRWEIVSCAREAAEVFQEHRYELGFVNQAQCEEKDLVVERRGGEVVGALLGNHCVRKPQSTVYELAVLPEYRRDGVATRLVERFATGSPHEQLVAKCPVDLPANDFYAATGWSLVGRETGKERPLNVWEYDLTERVEVYMTVNGGGETAEAINASAAYAGVEAANGWPLESSPAFVDYPFTQPDAGFDEHLEAVEHHEPRLTVAPDVEQGRSLSEVVEMADQIEEHADAVVIVPKDCHPTDVPDRFRVGLTAGQFGSMAPWGVWEYRDVESVHILGGSPSEQLAIGKHGPAVDSVDSFSLGRRARFGIWDDGAKDSPDDEMDYYDRLRLSLDNYTRRWQNVQ